MSELSLSLSTIDWTAVSAISTVLIAILGFFINRQIRKASEKTEKFSLLVEYRREIIDFSSGFLDATAKAMALSQPLAGRSVDNEECAKLEGEISALVDKGRFIFPNYLDGTDWGKDKGPAFAGFRREPLDAILACFFAVRSLRSDIDKATAMELARRELIKADQPFSDGFRADDAHSIIVEARRSFINAVVPSTFPREWRKEFSSLLGPASPISDAEADKRIVAGRWN